MAIRVNLAVVLAQRNVKSKELAEYIGITEANLSLLKSGKVKRHPLRYAGRDLPLSRVPTRRHPPAYRRRQRRLERFQEKWQRFSGSEARQNKELDHFSVSTKREMI